MSNGTISIVRLPAVDRGAELQSIGRAALHVGVMDEALPAQQPLGLGAARKGLRITASYASVIPRVATARKCSPS